jgi:hypothetical protein
VRFARDAVRSALSRGLVCDRCGRMPSAFRVVGGSDAGKSDAAVCRACAEIELREGRRVVANPTMMPFQP